MSTLGFIEYENASPEVRAVYDDIMKTRKTDKVTNFWKALAHDPVRLRRTWEDTRDIMAARALDPMVKELIYLAVSITNQCDYCIAAHLASAKKKGMTEAIFNEMQAIIGLANSNNRLIAGLQVEIDEQFKAIG
jgi:AhpD family alkylhydroperoxidase